MPLPPCNDVVVVGTGEAELVARAVGAIHAAHPGAAPLGRRAWLVWGAIEDVHELRSHAPGERVAWRVDRLDLPLAPHDARLLATVDRIVVGDAGTQAYLRDHSSRCVVIEPLPATRPRRRSLAVEVTPHPTVVIAVDTRSVGSTLVALKQLLDGGLSRCGSCGRHAAAAFDPSVLTFTVPASCGCGGRHAPLAPPGASCVVALRGDDDAGATAMCAWLGIGDRVRVIAEADVDVGTDDLVVDASAGIHPGWGGTIAAATGARLITAARHGATAPIAVGTRTESDPEGRVQHTIDPVDLHRVLTGHLETSRSAAVGADAPRRGDETARSAPDIVREWRHLLTTLASMEPRPSRSLQPTPLPRLWRRR